MVVMVLRGVLVVAGVAAGVVGLVELLDSGWVDQAHLLVWLAVGVVAHDVLLSGLAIMTGVLVVRLLPAHARAPAVIGLVVVATVTAAVLPTLTVTWTEPTNASLLDRPYGRNWLGFVGLVVVAVGAGSWWGHRRSRTNGLAAERSGRGRHPRG